jgi:hypothetical protein
VIVGLFTLEELLTSLFKGDCWFVNIRGIVDYHCLEVIVGSLTLEELLIITA